MKPYVSTMPCETSAGIHNNCRMTQIHQRERIHTMRLFDLHCDTIEELRNRGEDFADSTTQFSLRDREKFDKAVQVMAVFVPVDIRGTEAVRFVLDYYEYMNCQVEKTGGQAELVEKMPDLDRILNEKKWALIRSIENGAALGGNLDNINRFAQLNFKMMGLVWNNANELGSGPDNDTGLTEFGKAAVRRMEEAGMIVDCSHLNDAGFEDLLDVADRPFVASHSNVRACCRHPRNLTDRQFKEIVRRGGLCGLNLFSRFVDDGEDGSKDNLLRHLYHMLELGGEDVVAWGADMDGEITCDPDLSTPYGVGQYGTYLLAHGIGEEVVKKLYFDNAYRFFMNHVK